MRKTVLIKDTTKTKIVLTVISVLAIALTLVCAELTSLKVTQPNKEEKKMMGKMIAITTKTPIYEAVEYKEGVESVHAEIDKSTNKKFPHTITVYISTAKREIGLECQEKSCDHVQLKKPD